MITNSHKHIFLVGLSGSGKSTVGKILSRKLRRKFFDTDKLIAQKRRKSISRIFEEDGEKTFRKIEADVIRETAIENSKSVIVALGGGALQNPETRKLVRLNGVSLWLRCSLTRLAGRLQNTIDRPLLANTGNRRGLKKRLSKLLKTREKHYR
ncbi:MAG: shikimate kinase, partial [Candidatus Zixiibacteriota bacterium]